MTCEVETLFKVMKGVDYPVLLEKVDCIWMRVNDSIIWNTDNDEDDLLNQDGNTYDGYAPEGFVEYKGYLVCNIDGGIGTLVTMFFELNKEIKNG